MNKQKELKDNKSNDLSFWKKVGNGFIWIWNHKISILSYFASIYLIFFTIYSFNEKVNLHFKPYENAIKYFSQISILIFTSGVFAASLKYLQLLDIFKDQFSNYIESSQFDEKIKNNLKLITFSDEYLIQQNNLQTLWKQITLCMYKKDFPTLYDKISKKMSNTFFKKSNILYYYKNFQIQYIVEKKCDKTVKITERSSYTLVRPNKEEFEWDFSYTSNKNDAYFNDTTMNINIVNMKKNFVVSSDNKIEIENDLFLKISSNLSGHLEYHIEREIVTVQDTFFDKIRSFGSDRIIDDLSVLIKNSKEVEVQFHPLGDNKFYHNSVFTNDEKAFINRDILMPGQKYLLVFTIIK